MPLVVGRARSLAALGAAEGGQGLLVVVIQRVVTAGDPGPNDLARVGTLCKIESTTDTETGSRQIVVTGVARYRVAEYRADGGYLAARGEVVADTHSGDPIRVQALLGSLKAIAQEILELLPGATEPLIRLIEKVDDASYLTNVCAAYLNLAVPQKQELLETTDVERRVEVLLTHMRKEREVLNLQREIRDKMSERLNKAQREALLREQLRTIRSELGEEPGEEAVDDLAERLERAELPEEAAKQAADELRRLRQLPVASAEYHVVRTYLEWLASMPWRRSTPDNIDLVRARRILDEDHYGLEPVKRRILQFLAVARLKNDLHGPILCLLGPPGVGKTSLGQSIARTLGRKFIRTSLGGVRDEAEIRGHRRTYVGAMPGRIVQSIKRAGTRNPLMMLDEIDKLRADFHGDPSAAMLEVLDPEQNRHFTDHYLDVAFDLSDVFFIATANVMDTVPPALRDRMEIIEVNGYTTVEKIHIAREHLLPRELFAHGIPGDRIDLPDETIGRIISHYTREAGVRELQRRIAALLRAAAEEMVAAGERGDPAARIRLGPERLQQLLGPERFFPEKIERVPRPGVATGLAWTPHGGDLLHVEATRMPGKGELILTGQLGDVMKESARIALSLARSTSAPLGTRNGDFSRNDLHVHVPAGAIPKDGPSAGITILVALISLLLGRSVDPEVGMTGEITLRGAVLPVGGIKEKVLAAHRAELRRIVLPRRNEQDLVEVPEDVRRDLDFILIDTVDEALHQLFKIRLKGVEAVEAA
jgi:ATP-dependent Lon protease